jgi:uncharacterized protein YegL
MAGGNHRVVRPAIIVVDRSGSMADIIDKVEERVTWMLERLTRDDAMRETLVLAVIDFDYETRARRRLGYFVTDETGYQFNTRGGMTDFSRALRECRRILDEDLPDLASFGYRPAIFFVSDGGNNQGDFTQARTELLTRELAPKILTFEFRTADATPLVLQNLATHPDLYVPLDKTAEAVEIIIRTIFRTLGNLPGEGGGSRRGPEASGPDPERVAAAFAEGEIEFNGDPKVYEFRR